MYRPSTYNAHNESMNAFAKMFNDCELFPNIVMKPKEIEDYECDGYFVNVNTGEQIGYDWEIRDKYFKNGHFEFPTLGQYERKIKKADIELSLQSDSTKTAVAVAWHNDFKNSDVLNRSLSTDTKYKQSGKTRETKKFWIIKHEDIAILKQILHIAFETGNRSYDGTNPL